METCRTCAKCDFMENEDTRWLDIFYPEESNKKEIEHVRLELNAWKLKISQSDGLPHKICSDCFHKFCNVYAFRLECERAQHKLCNIFLDRIDTQSSIDINIDDDNDDVDDENSDNHINVNHDKDDDATSSLYKIEEKIKISDSLDDKKIPQFVSNKIYKIINDLEDYGVHESQEGSVAANADATAAADFITANIKDELNDTDNVDMLGNGQLNEFITVDANLNKFKVSNIPLEIARTTTTTTTKTSMSAFKSNIELISRMPPVSNISAQDCKSTTTSATIATATTTTTTKLFISKALEEYTAVERAALLENNEFLVISSEIPCIDNKNNNNNNILSDSDILANNLKNNANSNNNSIVIINQRQQQQQQQKPIKNHFLKEFVRNDAIVAAQIIQNTKNIDTKHDSHDDDDDDDEDDDGDNDGCFDGNFIIDKTFATFEDNATYNVDLAHVAGDDDLQHVAAAPDYERQINAHAHNDVDNNTNDELNFECNANNELCVTFECKYCYKPKEHYETQKLLLDHITAQHNSDLPFNCPKCDKCFGDAAGRTVHIKNEHVEKNFSCHVCGKRYTDRCNLRHHVEKYHIEVDFECNLCEKRFYSRKSLNYHKKWHNPELQQKCNYCDRLFINQRHLKCHEETHTGLRNCEYCSFCGKSFIHLKTLRWHVYRHHGGEKPYKCGSCPEAFASYREKRIHMLDLHAENLTSIEKSECMLCHKHYDDEKELKRHMSEDHRPRKATLIIANNKRVLQNKRQKSFSGVFQCNVCSQRFNMKSALERHSAVHSTEGRPYACPQCSKRFKRAQDMNWHMKTHSNEKPNICDVCGKGFALKYVLTQHKRSHEVLEKNFKCSTCGRAYLFEKTLRVHERVHSDKTYYKCDLCNESFVTHIKFKYHMNKKHAPDENGEIHLNDFINIVIP